MATVGISRRIIGIDPGVNGAIVALEHGQVIYKECMPKISKIFDIYMLVKMLQTLKTSNCHIFIEDVHAIFGSSANATFTFGETVGSIKAAVIALGFSYTLVQPKVWQKISFAGIPEIRKPSSIDKNGKSKNGKIDTKTMALIASKRLFPSVDTKASERCKIDHDGIVDALLIAYYGENYLIANNNLQNNNINISEKGLING